MAVAADVNNLSARKYALVAGLLMLLMGVLSLIPSLSSIPDYLPAMSITTSYGLFLGIFPMNILNKIALLAFGFAGVITSRAMSSQAAVKWAWWVFSVMGFAAILGLIPDADMLFGLWPLWGAEIVTHGLFAIGGFYYGYTAYSRARARAPREAIIV